MSVRLFHRDARLVIVARRRAVGDETWWTPHRQPPDWQAILTGPLALLGLSPQPEPPAALACTLGRIDWTERRSWSTITLRLTRGSERKRQLVAEALRKAARYAPPTARNH